MESYTIREKGRFHSNIIRYTIEEIDHGINIYLHHCDTNVNDTIIIGHLINETKRGWTISSNYLAIRDIKIFLPREIFEKKKI